METQPQFKSFCWFGEANGTALTPDFNVSEFQGRKIIIKRIKFVPYAKADSTNLYITQGATVYIGQIPAGARIDTTKIFDQYTNGLCPSIKVNGMPIAFFPFSTLRMGFPVDYDVDNINVGIESEINSIEISVIAKVFYDISIPDQLVDYCNIKVIMEVYLS